jgi:predicted permease
LGLWTYYMQIINILAPVFLIIVLGILLKKANFLSAEFVRGLNNLVYWIGLPCLLFYEIVIAKYDGRAAGATFLVVLGGMAGSVVVAYFTAGLLRIPAGSVGTFVQGAFRGNLMYIGLPIAFYSFAFDSQKEAMTNTAVLVLAFIIPIYNIAAVIVLLASQHKIDRLIFGKILSQLVTNPLVIATAAAFLYKWVFGDLHLWLGRTISAIGNIALPLALLGVGGTLAEGRIKGWQGPAFAASVIKCFITPAVGLVLIYFLGLNSNEARIALIYLACPAAVVSYVMADQLEGDPKMAAATVLVSTFISVLSLGAVLAIF